MMDALVLQYAKLHGDPPEHLEVRHAILRQELEGAADKGVILAIATDFLFAKMDRAIAEREMSPRATGDA